MLLKGSYCPFFHFSVLQVVTREGILRRCSPESSRTFFEHFSCVFCPTKVPAMPVSRPTIRIAACSGSISPVHNWRELNRFVNKKFGPIISHGMVAVG